MERFVRLLSSLTASLILVTLPAPSLALGFGAGLGARHASTVALSESDFSVEEDTNADVRLEIKSENRCKKLSGDNRTRCIELVKIQMNAHGDASHGKFMSALRHRIKDAREEGRDRVARVGGFLSGLIAQLRTVLNAEAEVALKVCKDKEDDEHEKCVADAKVKLQAKVNAAIEAMKK